MAVEDDDFLFRFAREFFQTDAQVQFLGGEKFVTETADLPERRRLDKNKRASHEAGEPTGTVPKLRDESGGK